MRVKSNVVFLIILFSTLMPWCHATAGGPVKVEAVNTSATPKILVVKTTGAKGRELTVGCRIENKTIIKVGKHPAKLKNFRSGNRVQLTYLRVMDSSRCFRRYKSSSNFGYDYSAFLSMPRCFHSHKSFCKENLPRTIPI